MQGGGVVYIIMLAGNEPKKLLAVDTTSGERPYWTEHYELVKIFNSGDEATDFVRAHKKDMDVAMFLCKVEVKKLNTIKI